MRRKQSTSQIILKGGGKAAKVTNPSPYQELQKGSVPNKSGVGLSKSESEDKLNEWTHIFSAQNSRWDSEFDGVKARLMQKLQADRESKFLKNYKLPEHVALKETPGFVVPNEYLPLEKRSVQPGIPGLKEKLRRDKITARKASRAGGRKGGLSPLPRDASLQTVGLAEQHKGRMKRDLSAQAGGFYSNLYAATPNSVSVPHHMV